MDWNSIMNLMPAFLEGTWLSIRLFFITLLVALPLGILIALGRMSGFRPLAGLVATLQWIIRGTPLMLQLIVVMYLPSIAFGIRGLDRFLAASIAFGINYAFYFSEIYRSGIESIPRGQREAAKVLGLSRRRTFMRVILPQTVKHILPAMGNEFMTLVKDTALAQVIGNNDLLKVAQAQMNRTTSMVPLLVAGIFYVVMNGLVQLGMNAWEKKLAYYQ